MAASAATALCAGPASAFSDAGSGTDQDGEENEKGKKPTIYDTRNAPARKALRALARKPGTKSSARGDPSILAFLTQTRFAL